MQDSLTLQIREHVAEYVSERTTVKQFLAWFMDAADEAEESGDAALLDLVDTIKLYWAEYTNGDHTEDDLRRLLHSLAETYVGEYRTPDAPQETTFTIGIGSQQTATDALDFSLTSNHETAPSDVRPQLVFVNFTHLQHETLTVVDNPQRNSTQELVLKG